MGRDAGAPLCCAVLGISTLPHPRRDRQATRPWERRHLAGVNGLRRRTTLISRGDHGQELRGASLPKTVWGEGWPSPAPPPSLCVLPPSPSALRRDEMMRRGGPWRAGHRTTDTHRPSTSRHVSHDQPPDRCALLQTTASPPQKTNELFSVNSTPRRGFSRAVLPGQRDRQQELAKNFGSRPGVSAERCPPCRANLSRRSSGCEGGSSKSDGGSASARANNPADGQKDRQVCRLSRCPGSKRSDPFRPLSWPSSPVTVGTLRFDSP